uniref:piRNA biogenesis protein EXD1-like n=1 Tax=Myxine glutinosa TaxID=7769 RepID=UPI00358F5F58
MENADVIAEFVNKRVRIVAHDVCFDGIVRFVDLLSGVLCLENVIDVAYGKKSLGMLMFPGKDISFIRILDKTKSQHPAESQTTEDVAENQTMKVDVPCIGTGVAAVKEDPSTEHLPYELINNLQDKFSSAIHHIMGEQVVGVAAKGLTISRFGKLSWLQVPMVCFCPVHGLLHGPWCWASG